MRRGPPPLKKIETKPRSQPKQIGKYLLIQRLDMGGMAEVYRGKLVGAGAFSKTVAIKRILADLCGDADFKQMFEREAVLTSSLNHPNIVQTFDYVASEEGYLLVMEFLNGKNLAQILTKLSKIAGEFPVVLSAYLVGEICKALDYAHNKKDERGLALRIVHRDISPHNIMIGFDGAVKILDFGIAKATDSANLRTATGILKGKLAYMSPEQANAKPVGPYTDIYGTGMVFYELLTGKRAISSVSEMEAIELAREGNFAPALKIKSTIPSELNAITMRAMAKNPENRYASAHEMFEDIQHYLSDNLSSSGQKEMKQYMESLFAQEIREALEEPEVDPELRPFEEHSLDRPVMQPTLVAKAAPYQLHPLWSDGTKVQAPTFEQRKARLKEEEPAITISLGWILTPLLLIGLGFGIIRYPTQIHNFIKFLTGRTGSGEISTTQKPASSTEKIFIPTKYKMPEPVTTVEALFQSNGGLITTPSKRLAFNQALIYFLSTAKSETATLKVLWKDANGESGGLDGCRISQQSVCLPEVIEGNTPFMVTIQPYQRNPGGPANLFSAESCEALGVAAKYDKVLGSCTLPIPPGETKIYVHLEKMY